MKIHLYHYIRSFKTFFCLKLIYRPQQHGLMFGLSYLNHLDMNTRFKVFASYNILQYLCDFYPCSYICNCIKMLKKSQINEYSDYVHLLDYQALGYLVIVILFCFLK
jgi:hypothetical protein